MHLLNHEQKKQKKEVNPIAVGLTGVVIGAAGAAAVALSDEETRKRATKKAKQLKTDLQKWSSKTIQDMQTRGKTVETNTQQKLDAKKSAILKEVTERLDEKESL